MQISQMDVMKSVSRNLPVHFSLFTYLLILENFAGKYTENFPQEKINFLGKGAGDIPKLYYKFYYSISALVIMSLDFTLKVSTFTQCNTKFLIRQNFTYLMIGSILGVIDVVR